MAYVPIPYPQLVYGPNGEPWPVPSPAAVVPASYSMVPAVTPPVVIAQIQAAQATAISPAPVKITVTPRTKRAVILSADRKLSAEDD
jgi:hypothetical protein